MAKYWRAPKDPDEVKDYAVDWSELLIDDTLLTSTWSVVTTGTGLVVIDSEDNDPTLATVWLSGGTLGVTYELLNRVTTAGGRTYDQTCRLRCRAK